MNKLRTTLVVFGVMVLALPLAWSVTTLWEPQTDERTVPAGERFCQVERAEGFAVDGYRLPVRLGVWVTERRGIRDTDTRHFTLDAVQNGNAAVLVGLDGLRCTTDWARRQPELPFTVVVCQATWSFPVGTEPQPGVKDAGARRLPIGTQGKVVSYGQWAVLELAGPQPAADRYALPGPGLDQATCPAIVEHGPPRTNR